MNEESVFSPAYTLRVSSRARRISLRMLPGKGLEVVLPQNADPSCVPDILARYRDWIARAASRVGESGGGKTNDVPEYFMIKGESECIVPQWGASPIYEFAEPLQRGGVRLPVRILPMPKLPPAFAGTERSNAWKAARLQAWVREEAMLWLEPMLRKTAERHGFTYSSLRMRFQKTRWGSCSIKQGINLNASLLFLPERLAEYIALHELCHTKAMNHGPSFWKLVFAADAEALQKDKAMRSAWKYVPGWIL